MVHLLRSFLVLLIALAFSAASTSWSLASISMASMGASTGHHALSADNLSSGQHEHGDQKAAERPDCLKANPTCGPKHHSDKSSSCCAAACHSVILALGCDMTVLVFSRNVERPLLEAVLEETPATRLDRPPRSIGL